MTQTVSQAIAKREEGPAALITQYTARTITTVGAA